MLKIIKKYNARSSGFLKRCCIRTYTLLVNVSIQFKWQSTNNSSLGAIFFIVRRTTQFSSHPSNMQFGCLFVVPGHVLFINPTILSKALGLPSI
jgi:hypothetical protein